MQPQHAVPAIRPERRAKAAKIVQGLRRMVKVLHTYSQDVQKTYGLTGPQLWALKTLQRSGPQSVGRLAAALAVKQSSMSVLLDRLARRGLVRRMRGRVDHRFVHVELTKRGAALATNAPEAAQGRLLHGLEAMPSGEVSNLLRAVDRLVEATEAADVTARFFFADE